MLQAALYRITNIRYADAVLNTDQKVE